MTTIRNAMSVLDMALLSILWTVAQIPWNAATAALRGETLLDGRTEDLHEIFQPHLWGFGEQGSGQVGSFGSGA